MSKTQLKTKKLGKEIKSSHFSKKMTLPPELNVVLSSKTELKKSFQELTS